MKKVFKGVEPERLKQYRRAAVAGTWDQFARDQRRKASVQNQLKEDQNGLCAYCEINIWPKNAAGLADFRVEHFHPKSDDSTAHNWHLDWQNLLGCCHGGSQQKVVDAVNRFTSPDHSCDVPKGNKNLDSDILNPLLLPAFPALFVCDRSTGMLSVNKVHCQSAGISELKARNTIDELRLDAPRLNRFRKRVLDALNDQLRIMISSGQSVSQARRFLAERLLCKDSENNWPAFFTSIRSYLGQEAEQHLRTISYNG